MTKPFFGRFWPSSLVNLLVACLLCAVSFWDVLVDPFEEWTAGEPAPFSYRSPVVQDSVSEELQSILGKDQEVLDRFVVRRGEILSEADLSQLRRTRPERMRLDPHRVGGVFIFFFMALMFFNLLLRRYGRNLLMRFRAVLSIYLALGAAVLASRLMLSLTVVSPYALPVVFATLLLTPLVGQNIGFTVHLLSLALIAPMLRFTPGMVLIPLVAGWTAVLLLNRDSGPMRMFIAASAGAAVGGLFLMGLNWFSPQNSDLAMHLEGDLVGLVGGMLASGLTAALLSYPTTVLFGAVPRSRLRSLLDLDHPLLKDLAEKAPGTFQHCLAVANMAEKVADDTGADAQLVRAGAYYHDIGKMREPVYFIENQQGDNPHDQLQPADSAKKLRGHIQFGVTIARGANLPERIIDFIIEHHGLSTMEYFLDKAFRTDAKAFDRDNFRYQGRNPSCRETGILMIVDSVEAASRTLSEPSQDDIENLVRRILFSKLLHGYLDSSTLTTKDLKQIGISLIKFLQGQFHVRVTYPWQKKETDRPPLQVVPDTHAGIRVPAELAEGRVAAPIDFQAPVPDSPVSDEIMTEPEPPENGAKS